MADHLNREVFAEWQRLIGEWEEAKAASDEAQQTSLDPTLGPAEKARLESEAREASARLARLKDQIDAMVRDTGAARPPLGDEFLVATTDPVAADEDEATDDERGIENPVGELRPSRG